MVEVPAFMIAEPLIAASIVVVALLNLRSTPDPEPMRQAAMVTGGTDQAAAKDVWDARGETIPYTEDLWPWVLLLSLIHISEPTRPY